MKITALEIKQHEFEKSFRGYNIEEVDIFLNNLASEWERTSNESKMLRMQLEIAEKEAAKLREVEMSLIKTLQNAETTSSKITEQAKNEAERKVEEATLEAQRIAERARKDAETVLEKAKNTVSENQKTLINQEAGLKEEIRSLEKYKADLIGQLKALSSDTLAKIDGLRPNEVKKEIQEPSKEEDEDVQGIASSANTMVLNKAEELKKVSDDLTIVEGIGPKIADILNENGVKSYRDLAITPAYKIKEFLNSAGSNYAMHDPSSWAEQAILADSGKWDELELLKEKLIGGREVEEDEVPETPEQVTEEMLQRVNKVKAALKKAMMEKGANMDSIETSQKEYTQTERPSNQSVANGGGSFFDNLG